MAALAAARVEREDARHQRDEKRHIEAHALELGRIARDFKRPRPEGRGHCFYWDGRKDSCTQGDNCRFKVWSNVDI